MPRTRHADCIRLWEEKIKRANQHDTSDIRRRTEVRTLIKTVWETWERHEASQLDWCFCVWYPSLPGESGAQVKAVYVLADEVFEVSCPLQLQQGHVSQAGTRVLKRGVKVRRLASLLHRPHSFRTSDEHKQHRDHKHALTEIQSLVLSFSQESFWVTSWKIKSSLIFWNIGLDVL